MKNAKMTKKAEDIKKIMFFLRSQQKLYITKKKTSNE